MNHSRKPVTLVVYEWIDNQPGTLAWVFPTFGAAVRAVRALRNAVGWLIVAGVKRERSAIDVDDVRKSGAILLERLCFAPRSGEGRREAIAQTRSSTTASPWPPPMHALPTA